jgi:putative tryptophan/tyrosine transport system substrate-binding protein
MRRREFIGGVCAAAAWPFATAPAAQSLPSVGFLLPGTPASHGEYVSTFLRGLGQEGLINDRDYVLDLRYTEEHPDRIPALVRELVDKRVDVLAVGGPAAAVAAKAATATIPIVFVASNPVDLGLVASLNRPGSNITGVGLFGAAVEAKKLELLHQLVPEAGVIGVLVNPNSPTAETVSKDLQATAQTLGLRLHILNASKESEIDFAFATLVELHAGPLQAASEPFFDSRRDQLVALASRHSLPAVYSWPEYVAAGGLMSYGTVLSEAYREAGVYAGRILKGEKPADLPVVQPTKFELVINLKTAKELGLTVPQSILAGADEVIE